MLLLIGLSGYFAITLYSILRGQQTLTIDFPRKQFIFSRIHRPLLKKNELNPIDFSKVHSVALKQMALAYNNKWTRIKFLDQNGNILTYMDLGADFPDTIIAEKLKFFLSVVLWAFNEKRPKCA